MSNGANGFNSELGQLTTPTRNLYPYGKLLDSYHLVLEQWYYRLQRYLANRLVLGSGVVCGLQVMVAKDGTITVGPGVAFDLVGREIEVPQMSRSIDPRQPTDDRGAAQGSPIEGAGAVTLCLAYHECEAELIPLLVSECECEERCAASTVCERYALIIHSGEPDTTVPSCMFPEIFGADADPNSIHAKLVDRISQACPPKPSETCVVLARISLPANGGAVTAADIDPTPRPLVVGNALLLELLLCLAARVEACCNGATTTKTKTLEKVAGDNQTGAPGAELPVQPTVLVQEDGAPLPGEIVTFTVTDGGGTISSGGPFANTGQVTTDANGHAAITWKLGDGNDENTLQASIASGAPPVTFTATPTPKIAPPRVMLVWPPNEATLGPEDAQAKAMRDNWMKNRRFEITFDREMSAAQLAAPHTWLRIWRIQFNPKNQNTSITPVELSFDPNNPPTLDTAGMGPTATYRFPKEKSLTLKIRYAIQIRAGDGGGTIESAEPEPQLLDADFPGTNLTAHQPGDLLKDLWNITAFKTAIGAFWNFLPGAAATLPASGDGSAGGIYHGYFEVD
jgi:hypothetical protein